MQKIPQLKNKQIYYPCTPGKWISEPEYKKITKIQLTSGGGITGSKWVEYVEQTDNIESNTIQEFTRITGKKIKINTSYITYAEDFILVSVMFDNKNPNVHHLGINVIQYIMDEDIGEVCLLNGYGQTQTY